MGSNWTDEEWMVDVLRHYEDGYRFGAEDMKKRITEALSAHVDVVQEWQAAIELIEEISID